MAPETPETNLERKTSSLAAVASRSFGEDLRRRRLRKNLSQSDLAERAGIAQQYLCRIEGGQLPRPVTVVKLAKALGVRPDLLMSPAFRSLEALL